MNKEVSVILRRSNRQLRLRRTCLLLFILCSMPVHGQVKDQEAFAPVPAALRAGLVERLKLLIEYQRTQQWEKQYELLSNSSVQGESKEEYAKRSRHWYREVVPEDLIIDFVPKVTTTREASADAGWWTIYGCAKLRRKGRTEQLHASVDAHRERGDWYFSSIGVITSIDGPPQQCPYLDLSAAPCSGKYIRKTKAKSAQLR